MLCLCVLVLRARFVRCVAVCVCFLLLSFPVCTYQFRSHGQDPTPTPKQTKCLLSSVFLRLKCWDLLLVLLKNLLWLVSFSLTDTVGACLCVFCFGWCIETFLCVCVCVCVCVCYGKRSRRVLIGCALV